MQEEEEDEYWGGEIDQKRGREKITRIGGEQPGSVRIRRKETTSSQSRRLMGRGGKMGLVKLLFSSYEI